MIRHLGKLWPVIVLCLVASLAGQASAKKEGVRMALQPFDMKQVRLLDGPCKDAMEADRKYLFELDNDRLLHNFRTNAGLPAPGTPLGASIRWL